MSDVSIDDLREAIERAQRVAKSPWMTTKQAAEYLHSTEGTLKTWRAQGRGPRSHGSHRFVRYNVADLDAFLAQGAAR